MTYNNTYDMLYTRARETITTRGHTMFNLAALVAELAPIAAVVIAAIIAAVYAAMVCK